MEFILLINVKMPTIVGILTFKSRIDKASESFKARKKSLLFSIYKNVCVDKNFIHSRAEYENSFIIATWLQTEDRFSHTAHII